MNSSFSTSMINLANVHFIPVAVTVDVEDAAKNYADYSEIRRYRLRGITQEEAFHIASDAGVSVDFSNGDWNSNMYLPCLDAVVNVRWVAMVA